MTAFREHPLRQRLNDEVHSRPPMALSGAEWISYLAVLHDGGDAATEEAHLHQLCGTLGTQLCPVIQGDHWVMEAGDLRLKWERHNEFSSYTFFRRRQPGDPLYTSALSALPADWLAAIPGTVLVATHIELRPAADMAPETVLADLAQRGDTVVASQVADGAAWVYSDFQLHDGYSRFLVLDDHLTHRQAGRTVQRLLEIETYRMMALLAFPVAKEVGRFLARAEGELADLMDRMGEARSTEDERVLLTRLTRLAAEVERSVTRTAFRFGAAEAYYALVQQRIRDLREQRIAGFPPIDEFMERRLAPAISTCLSVARRQTELSTRIARKSALLRTRVDIELERQNQELLTQMNRRAKLQLRLQETVEGLSVVAITYYASQLVTYVYKGMKSMTGGPSYEVITAIAVPVIGALVAISIRRMRRALAAEEEGLH
ncbi:hypothetical protein OTERR_26040 [Oryzomicrobium terrae]|uniref:Membrane-anchored protein n=1 Tax=Oryzomicrobium terrae TaxID=1735038 RepID=A0A5C1EAX8_9RHOO|nr:DUF3422 domain-containing protein [Oryzomicrobium terrae]QEL66080.1 hypothetical protein OTERR_26040 [Oryzomicrobium terrae]